MGTGGEAEYIGPVEKVVASGRHGSYAIIRDKVLGCITFSLSAPVWNEPEQPEEGTFVVLSQVRKRRAGWRAMRGRFMIPSDEKQETRDTATEHSKETGK